MKSPRIQLAAAVALLLALLAGYFVWYRAILTASGEAAGLVAAISTEQDSSRKAENAKALLAGLREEEQQITNHFVTETGVVGFIDRLQSLAHNIGASLSVLSVSSGTVGGQPALSLALRITGTFDQVVRTVGAVEYAPFDITENTLVITRGEKGVWQADLIISVGSLAVLPSGTTASSTTATGTKPLPAVAPATSTLRTAPP